MIAKVDELVYAEDLSTGLCWTSEFRRVTAADVADFARLTGDNDPLHRDASESSPFGRPIAHGLLGLSILAGLGTRYPNASTLALVGIEDWEFIAPVFFGDSVQVRNEVVDVQPHGRRAVRVRWLRQLINDQGRVVQQGHFITLVGSRSRIVSSKPR
ncbi:acyl dehydratase [Roseiconus nitratireducens]|uniref:Acyl dehydratase n=1 Tax=Roseiconus nitratireducens TaxID=2605748 RepID=A0A5M6D8P0_9BACT|nr:acyl dehydratase [Roseiconus nitratireducens]